jgi:hypothetical protein
MQGGDKKCVYKILVGNTQGKEPLGGKHAKMGGKY